MKHGRLKPQQIQNAIGLVTRVLNNRTTLLYIPEHRVWRPSFATTAISDTHRDVTWKKLFVRGFGGQRCYCKLRRFFPSAKSSKKFHSTSPQKLNQLVPDGASFQKWALEVICHLLTHNKQDNRFIIAVVDCYTRWPVAWSIKDCFGATVRRYIDSEIIVNFRKPEFIVNNGVKVLTSRKTHNYLG